MDIHVPLQTRRETRCPGWVTVSCLASRTRHKCPRHNKGYIMGGLTLDVDRHYIGSVTATTHKEKRHNNTWVEPLEVNCTTNVQVNEFCLWMRISTIEVPKDVRNSESENMTSSGENGLHIRTNASPKNRQDQVSGRVSVLCWLAAPVVLWKPPKFGIKVKIGNKVRFGKKFANWSNVWSIEGFTVYGHVPDCHVTFGRGRLHNV